jgi:phospholipase/lecithinase/hemolysin
LSTLAHQFKEEHPEANVAVYDSRALFNKVLDHPTEYGFINGSTYGKDSCVWYDILHPTSQMHKVIAADVAKFLTGLEVEAGHPNSEA